MVSFAAELSSTAVREGITESKEPILIKSVAIMPLENLTGNQAASDIVMDSLKKELKGKGWVLVTREDAVDEFLAKRRIRYTGAITRLAVREMGKVLGVDAVLLGSVNSYSDDSGKVVVGVSCRLLSTATGGMIWADNLTYTGLEFEGFLGRGIIKSLDVLATMVVKDMVKDIADRFFVRETAMSPFEIERVIIYPSVGKAGEKRELKVRIVPLGEEPKDVKVRVGGEDISLRRSGDFEYEGSFTSPADDGIYDVDIISYDSNMMPYEVAAAGELTVDNAPPMVAMRVDKDAFASKKRKSVMIEPKLASFDDINEWRVEVRDANGIVVRDDRGYGRVPNKLVWRGETNKKSLAEDGVYTVKLIFKDQAGNEGFASEDVKIKNTPPNINVDIDVAGEFLVFKFEGDKDDPLVSWKVIVSDKDGNTLKVFEAQGNKIALPEKLEYPLDGKTDLAKITFSITAEDEAGNVFNLNKTIPSMFAKKAPFAKAGGTNLFMEDF